MDETENTGAPQAAEPTAGGEQQQASESGGDFGPLMERFDDLGERMGRIEQGIGGQDQGYDQGYDQGDLSQIYGGDGQDLYDEQGYPVQPDQGMLDQQAAQYGQDRQFDPQAMQGFVQQAVDQALQPHLERQADERRHEEAMALEEQYPDLRKQEVADKVIGEAKQFASQLVDQLGIPQQVAQQYGLTERLARQPNLIEAIYKAERADLSAAQETPAGADEGFDLETGGGRQPTPDEDDPGQRMVEASRGANFWT